MDDGVYASEDFFLEGPEEERKPGIESKRCTSGGIRGVRVIWYEAITSNLLGGDNFIRRTEHIVAAGYMKGVEMFVFTDNMVFERNLYKGTSKSHLLFGFDIRLHQVQMQGKSNMGVIHI